MKYTGWLIYNHNNIKKNKAYINWFIKEAALQDITLLLMEREKITLGFINNQRIITYNNAYIEIPDFAVIRTIEPLIQLHLSEYGVKVFNSFKTSFITNHKSWTYHELGKLNVPMLDTLFLTKEAIPNEPPLPYPFVVKDATGRSGKQVFFISDHLSWKAWLSDLQSNDYVVQACNVKLGCDVRVFIIGKKIIGAVLRENKNDFRANFTLGGIASSYELKQKDRDMIEKIMNHFDFDMVGIDFLIGDNGQLFFNEIEDVVGSRTLSAVSKINLLQAYVSHIKYELKN